MICFHRWPHTMNDNETSSAYDILSSRLIKMEPKKAMQQTTVLSEGRRMEFHFVGGNGRNQNGMTQLPEAEPAGKSQVSVEKSTSV